MAGRSSLPLLARRIDKLEQLALPNTLARQVDVTRTAAFKAAVEDAEAAYGPVDCLVNNAGLMSLGPLDTRDPDEWRRMSI